MLKTWECRTKGCPNQGLTFQWDNADEGTRCRVCDKAMHSDTGKAGKAKPQPEVEDD